MKKTTEMTAKERRALQAKLDAMLQEAIANVSQHYELYDIEPSVRITNNKSRLGSAKASNGALLFKERSPKRGVEMWNKLPVFQISITTRECDSDNDINDTLYHEVIHCIPGCFNHGKKFKAAADKINAAFGVNVTTRKREEPSGPVTSKRSGAVVDTSVASLKKKLERRIGKSFTLRGKKYKFLGFNGRPKRCCDLQDARGAIYICDVYSCARGFGII